MSVNFFGKQNAHDQSGYGDGLPTWRNVVSYTMTGANDWPDFLNIPDSDLYRVRMATGVNASYSRYGSGTAYITLRFDNDSTAIKYASSDSDNSIVSNVGFIYVAGLGEGGPAWADVELRRATFDGNLGQDQKGIVSLSRGAVSVPSSVPQAYNQIWQGAYNSTSTTKPALSRWTFGCTQIDYGPVPFTISIDVGVDDK